MGRMRGRRYAAVAGAVALLLLPACAEDGSSDDQGDARTTANTATTEAPLPTRLKLLTAKATVERFYAAVDNQNFATAWSYLARERRVDFGGFATYRAGFANTESTTLTDATPSRIDDTTASVDLSLETVDSNECGTFAQSFAGAWIVELVGPLPKLVESDIEQVGGEAPVDCAPAAPADSPAPETQNCHPSYPGACLDPAASDYDCAGGTGDGPEYTDGPIAALPEDPYGLDQDGDGTACE